MLMAELWVWTTWGFRGTMFAMERARVVGVSVTPVQKALERRRLKLEKRDGRHSWSYAKVSRRLIPILGEYTPNDETIRRYHTTAAPDPIVLAAVCELYGLALEDVDSAAYEVMRRVRDRIDDWCGIRTIDITGQAIRTTVDDPWNGSQDPLPLEGLEQILRNQEPYGLWADVA